MFSVADGHVEDLVCSLYIYMVLVSTADILGFGQSSPPIKNRLTEEWQERCGKAGLAGLQMENLTG